MVYYDCRGATVGEGDTWRVYTVPHLFHVISMVFSRGKLLRARSFTHWTEVSDWLRYSWHAGLTLIEKDSLRLWHYCSASEFILKG
jgi:hypothetical protein